MNSTDLRRDAGNRAWRGALLLLVVALPAPLLAAETVARVLAAVGAVHATDTAGQRRALQRRDPVHAGDLVETGPGARVQLRFSDGAVVALKAETRFRVVVYSAAPGAEEAALELLKGGLRTITGAIGRERPDAYRVSTPVSTIGIRGTHYGLHLCAGDCPAAAGEALPEDGLYGGVIEGGVQVTNRAGSLDIGSAEYFFVGGTDRSPRRIAVPPSLLYDGGTLAHVRRGSRAAREYGSLRRVLASRPALRTRLRGQLAAALEDYAAGEQTERTGSLPLGATTSGAATVNLAPPGSMTAIAFIRDGNGQPVAGRAIGGEDYVVLASAGAVDNVPVLIVFPGGERCDPCAFSNNDATLVQEQTVTAAGGVEWTFGTWLDGHVVVGEQRVATTGPFHFLYQEDLTPRDAVDRLGLLGSSVTYDLIASGPLLADRFNTTYTVTAGSLTVDFIGRAFTDMNLTAMGGGTTWQADLDGVTQLGPGLRDGLPLAGACSGPDCGAGVAGVAAVEGRIKGAFAGPMAEGFGGSVELETANGANALSGVAVFER